MPGGGDTWSAKQWHEVVKGESLWKIAERYYGDGSLYPKIFEANRELLKDPDRIKIGQCFSEEIGTGLRIFLI